VSLAFESLGLHIHFVLIVALASVIISQAKSEQPTRVEVKLSNMRLKFLLNTFTLVLSAAGQTT
jgi:hypothetical protein